MATKQQILTVLAAATGPVSRASLEEEIGESYRSFQTQLDRFEKQELIHDEGDHHYILTDKGREEALAQPELDTILGPGATPTGKPDKGEQTEETLGSTEYQQFVKFGKVTGVVPIALIIQTAEHVWAGGSYRDLKWVAQALQEMGIRQDLRARWFHSWRSYLKQPVPTELPTDFLTPETKGAEERKDEKGTGKRDYILSEDDTPTHVGDGLGDLDYKDAVELSKIRAIRKKDVSQSGSNSPVDDALKIVEVIKTHLGEKAAGKSYVVKPGEGGYQVEEVDGSKPVIIPQPGGDNKPGPSYLVQNDGTVKELPPGQPVVIIKEAPKALNTGGTQYLIDSKTGEIKEVAAGQPVVIIRESTPASQSTPIQMTDKDGKPMILDLSTFIKLEEHRDKTRREEESHETKMEIAKGFKDLLNKAGKALTHMAEEEKE